MNAFPQVPEPNEEEARLPEGVTTPMQAPKEYFGGLAEHLLAGVKASEEPSDALRLPSTLNPFRVPEGYFETLPEQLINTVSAQPLKPRMAFYFRPLRLAAAAVVLLSISFGLWQLRPQENTQPYSQVSLSSLNAADIRAYEEATGISLSDSAEPVPAELMAQLSAADIQAWQDATGETLDTALE